MYEFVTKERVLEAIEDTKDNILLLRLSPRIVKALEDAIMNIPNAHVQPQRTDIFPERVTENWNMREGQKKSWGYLWKERTDE